MQELKSLSEIGEIMIGTYEHIKNMRIEIDTLKDEIRKIKLDLDKNKEKSNES